MKNTLEGIKNRVEDKNGQISNLENRESTKTEQKKEKKINEDKLRDVFENIKWTNIYIIGAQEEERQKKGRNFIWRNNSLAWNFPNIRKETDIKVQEAHKVPNKMNSGKSTP